MIGFLNARRARRNAARVQASVRRFVEENADLKATIEYVEAGSKSVGTSVSDYVALYQAIRKLRPRCVLECGTGRSTHVIAEAMHRFCRETHGNDIKLVSMDHIKEWADHNRTLLRRHIRDFTEVHYSPMDTWGYSFVRGTVFKEVPEHPYEFVFVDGPFQGFEGEIRMCNIDFIRVVSKAEQKVAALVDSRKYSMTAYGILLGSDKVSFHNAWNLGAVQPVNRHDLRLGNERYLKSELMPRIVPGGRGAPMDVL